MVYLRNYENFDIAMEYNNPLDPIDGMKVNGKTPSKEELEKTGFFVKSMPVPEVIEGKYHVFKANKEIKKVWIEYFDVQKTQEEIQKDLIDNIILDNINMQMQIDTLIASSLV
jgi:hypothetical protein